MLKLLLIIPFLLLLAASNEPQSLSSGEPEPLSLSDAAPTGDELSTGLSATLEISTIPQEALIFIDGKHLGISPINRETVAPGDHYLSIKKQGYFGYDKDILLSRGKNISLMLPLIQLPPGHREALHRAESRAGAVYDLQTGAFRKWLHSPQRYASDLKQIADASLRLADALEAEGLNRDALQCRNAACGFYSLLDLAAGSNYFADDTQVSIKVAQDTRPDAAANDAALLRLVKSLITDLSSDDPPVRANAAHALRYTYCSSDAASLASDALTAAGKSETDSFVSFVILEATQQISFEPEGE